MEKVSRTKRKRLAEALQQQGEQLLELDDAQVQALDLPLELKEAVIAARRTRSHGARRRQLQYIGRLMRNYDSEMVRTALQKRRLNEMPAAYAPDGSHLEVAEAYWQETSARSSHELCNLTFFESVGPGRFQFRFLNEDMHIDLLGRCLLEADAAGHWKTRNDPLLALATVIYLKNVRQVFPLAQDIVSAQELKEGHFFSGPHQFRIDPLLARFGQDVDGFKEACRALGGKSMAMADAAFQLLPFPRLPLYFLLWAGDEEFKPRLQILFDRAIETIMPADAIWALVNRVVMAFGHV